MWVLFWWFVGLFGAPQLIRVSDYGTMYSDRPALLMERFCTFIIDAGSCENVIFETAVSKLALPTETLRELYNLVWLSEGIDVTVSKHALVFVVYWSYLFWWCLLWCGAYGCLPFITCAPGCLTSLICMMVVLTHSFLFRSRKLCFFQPNLLYRLRAMVLLQQPCCPEFLFTRLWRSQVCCLFCSVITYSHEIGHLLACYRHLVNKK